ncbi:MAG: serine/threonine-protein kinase [Pseudomonadota bacterium]
MTTSSTDTSQNKFEIVKALGRGGMGEVYLARDLRLDRLVAVKYLRTDLDQEKWRAQLAQEAQFLAKLNSPNVVQIYDITELNDKTALIMEYIDGQNLHICLREQRPPLPQLLHWLSEIASGLASAHSVGVVHNDLKAENVLIGQDNVAKVSDFGIAGAQQEPSEDVLALGNLATEMLANEQPLAPSLSELLAELTHKKPSQRPTAEDAATRLRHAWLESTQSETPLPEEATPKSQKPKIAIGAVGLVILAVTGLFLLQQYGMAKKRTYVAVLPTTIESFDGELTEQQQFLRSSVQQAIRESVIDAKRLALVSDQDLGRESRSIQELRTALGADEVIRSRVDCINTRNCEVTIERLGGPDLDVIKQRNTALLVDLTLESYAIVQRQWPQLYPEVASATDVTTLISDEDYLKFLAINEASLAGSVDLRETLEDLEALLVDANRFGPLYWLYAETAMNAYVETGNTEYLDRLDRVLRSAETWAGDSIFLQQSRFSLALQRQDHATAASIIDSIESLGADEALIQKIKGDRYRYLGDFSQASEHYSRALDMQPSQRLYWKIAHNYYYWGKLDIARVFTQRALEIYPSDATLLGLLGLIMIEQGDLSSAIEVLQETIKLDPHAAHRINLGLAYTLAGEYQEAVRELQLVYDSGRREANILLNIADAEMLMGNTEQAVALYANIISIYQETDNPANFGALAQAYAQMGDFEAAIAMLGEIEGQDGIPAFDAALVYTLAGQDIAALVEIDRALSTGFGAVWFRLPWFNSLCAHDKFSILLENAGDRDRCKNTPLITSGT